MKAAIEFHISTGFYLYFAILLLLLPFPWLLSILFAGIVHEAGHLVATKCMRVSVHSISLEPGSAKIASSPMTHSQEFFAAMAGPFAGALLVLLFPWFPRLAICALVQTLFNLIPVLPFDGGRMLHSVAAAVMGQGRGKAICRMVAAVMTVTFIILSLVLFKFSTFAAVVCMMVGIRCIKSKQS